MFLFSKNCYFNYYSLKWTPTIWTTESRIETIPINEHFPVGESSINESYDDTNSQKYVDDHADHEGHASLVAPREVQDGVDNPGHCVHPEDDLGQGHWRVSQDVQETQDPEYWNVLQVVLVCSPHSFNIWVVCFNLFGSHGLRIFFIHKHLLRDPVVPCNGSHNDDFQGQNSSVEDIVGKHRVL